MNKNIIAITVSIVIAGLCISGSIIYLKNNQDNINVVADLEKNMIQRQIAITKNTQVSLVHIIATIPQYNIATKKVPYKYCENVNETIVIMKNKQDGSTGGAVGGLTGAVAGAVIGKQLSGNDNGTLVGGIIGAVAGALAGSQIEKTQTEQVPQQISKRICSTHYNKVEYKNISGYKVVYEYDNQKSEIFTRKKPSGNYLPLNELI